MERDELSELEKELENAMDNLDIVIRKFEDQNEAVERVYSWLDCRRK